MSLAKTPQTLPKNNRVSAARSTILDCFCYYKAPIDYAQIMAYLLKNLVLVNKTTIYRQLDYLQKNKIIQEIDLGEGKKRYEIISAHHHHLRCTNCNKIECIEFKENFNPQLAEISKLSNFKVTGHELEFTGLCSLCQKQCKGVKND